jgi:hypothetical protein
MGQRVDYGSALAAADIYLDSYPCTSITSMLEAMLAGLPALTLADPANGPLNFDDFAARPLVVGSSEEWVEAVLQWCDDPDGRTTAGNEMSEQTSIHTGSAWMDALSGACSAVRPGTARLPKDPDTEGESFDLAILRLHETGGLAREFGELMTIHSLFEEPAASPSD